MMHQLLLKEMVSAVERERKMDYAQGGRAEMIAQGGRNESPTVRAKKMLGALVQRMGRPLERGSAPAGGETGRLSHANTDSARYSSQSMSIARY
jgi:hypothetical protein